MTIVAWDGTSLAADKLVSYSGMRGTVTKIRVVDVKKYGKLLAGGAGNGGLVEQMFRWFESGGNEENFPKNQFDPDNFATMIVIRPDRQIQVYGCSPFPIVIEDTFWAIGCGDQYAMAAMECGASAIRAVEVATKFDCNCGNGMDVLHYSEIRRD